MPACSQQKMLKEGAADCRHHFYMSFGVAGARKKCACFALSPMNDPL